jgi:hypothetical protein
MNKIIQILNLDGNHKNFTSLEDIIQKLKKIKIYSIKNWLKNTIDILEKKDIETYLYILFLFNKHIKLDIVGFNQLKDFYKLIKIKPYKFTDVKPLGVDYLVNYINTNYFTNLTSHDLQKYYKIAICEIKDLESKKYTSIGKNIPFHLFIKEFKKCLEQIDLFFCNGKNKIIVKETNKVGSFTVEIVNNYPVFYIYKFAENMNIHDYISTAIHEYVHFLQFLNGNKLNYFISELVLEGFAHYVEEKMLGIIPNMEYSYKRDTLLRLYRYKLIYEFHTNIITAEQMKKYYIKLMEKNEGMIEYYYSLINPRKMIYFLGKKMFQEKQFDWKKATIKGAVYQAKILK